MLLNIIYMYFFERMGSWSYELLLNISVTMRKLDYFCLSLSLSGSHSSWELQHVPQSYCHHYYITCLSRLIGSTEHWRTNFCLAISLHNGWLFISQYKSQLRWFWDLFRACRHSDERFRSQGVIRALVVISWVWHQLLVKVISRPRLNWCCRLHIKYNIFIS